MTPRIPFHGSPKLYHNFLDESLNIILRDIAKFAYRHTFEYRLFSLLLLQGALKLCPWLDGPDWLSLVACKR